MKNEFLLKDVIWEFTSKCNKKCKFCGSKEIVNDKRCLSYEQVNLILDEILNIDTLEYLTITGGEPATDEMLVMIVREIILRKPDLKIRILTNGLFFNKPDCKELFNTSNIGVGVSINCVEDFNNVEKLIEDLDKNRITMITNFGYHNFKDFLYLYEISKKFGLWQVQLTIDDELQLMTNDKLTLKNMFTLVDNSHIVFADNFNTGNECTAGKASCSITYLGEVIPCLSYRSWRKTLDKQGVISKKGDLLNIWNTMFKKYRSTCDNCISCKDVVDLDKLVESDKATQKYIPNYNPIDNEKLYPSPFNQDMVVSVYSARIKNDFNNYIKE